VTLKQIQLEDPIDTGGAGVTEAAAR